MTGGALGRRKGDGHNTFTVSTALGLISVRHLLDGLVEFKADIRTVAMKVFAVFVRTCNVRPPWRKH